MTEKDAFDLWWEWAEKPLDSPLTIDAAIHDAVMALPPDERRDRASLSVKWERQRLLSISAMVRFNDDHSIMASMRAAIPAAMNAAVMFAICKLRSCGAKIAVPIVPVPANANSQFLGICSGQSRDRDCGKNES